MTDLTPTRDRGALQLVPPAPERPAAKAQRLMLEARAAGEQQIEELKRSAIATMALAREIEVGGDVYRPGVREACRQIADEISIRLGTIEAIERGNRR